MQSLRVIATADGSSSVLNTRLNETYHSTHGAIQESQFIFIDRGLDFWVSQNQALAVVNILEIGFGTGLNALLALQYAEKNQKKIVYESLEAFPIEESVWSELNYPTQTHDNKHFQSLHSAPWGESVEINDSFLLRKRFETLQAAHFSKAHFDVVFFDAFAPSTQPELWEIEMLSKVVSALKPAGVFVTYCAKGQLKRDLKTLSLSVEKVPGPPGKREFIRGVKVPKNSEFKSSN